MKRTLSLVLALVMVLGTFSTVFAAVEDDAADVLEQIGVLLGDDDGNLMLDKNLERRDSVVLLTRLLGVEDEAAEFLYTEELPSWGDVDSDPYYLGYLAWAESNEYYQGDDLGNFNPRNPITAQEFLLVLFRALGYEDPAWGEEFELAEELGLLEGTDLEEKDELLRGAMSVLILNALNTNVNGEDITLAEKLEIEMPAPAALEVAEVVADNLKEVEVVFNQEVDAATVVDANVKVKDEKGSVALKDDGVTAVITMATNLKNQTEYTLVVEKVEAVSGVVIEKTEVKFRAFDAELPEVLGLEVTGPRNFALTFSEPVDKDGSNTKVTIKQGNVTLGNSIGDAGTNKVNVNAYTNFVEGREYEVKVEGFKDYAGYSNIVEVLTFTYEKDSTPPVATVDKVEQTYVVVSFNKPVKGLKAANFYHTFTAWDAIGIYSKAEFIDANKVGPADSVSKVYVQFYKDGTNANEERAIPAGSTVFGINGKDIKDNWGNALGNQEFTISATADRVAPEVVSIEVKEDNKLKITFSKEVKFGRDNIEILDQDGKRISGLYLSGFSNVAAKEFTISYNKNLEGKTVTVSIKDVEDTSLFKNVLSLYTEVIEIEDTVRPVVTAAYFEKEKETEDDPYSATIYVQFSEAVDGETAQNIKNYSIVAGGRVYILDGNAEFNVVNSRVQLVLTEAKAKEVHDLLIDGAILQIINVEDLAGNAILPVQYALDGDIDAETIVVNYTVKATAIDELEVEFDDRLANVKPESLAVLKDGGDDPDYGKGFDLTILEENNKTILRLHLDDELEEYDATDAYFAIKVDGILNSFERQVTSFASDGTYIDEIKPVIAEDEDDDYLVEFIDEDTLKITFVEKMYSVSRWSFGVDGRTVNSASLDESGKVATLTLAALGADDYPYGIDVGVSYDEEVRDLAGNFLDLDLGVFAEVEFPASLGD